MGIFRRLMGIYKEIMGNYKKYMGFYYGKHRATKTNSCNDSENTNKNNNNNGTTWKHAWCATTSELASQSFRVVRPRITTLSTDTAGMGPRLLLGSLGGHMVSPSL